MKAKSETQPQLSPPDWPAAMSDETAARFLDISPSLLWRLAATGELPQPVKLPGARCSRWRKSDLDAYLAELSAGGRK